MKLPLEIVGAAVRDAEGRVIISALNPCNMQERRQIVAAVNATAEGRRARAAKRAAETPET